jgi:oxygen-independent coproporphyrinogen-3 oxidase
VHLYVHVPFCSRRCSYCDFAIAVRREVPVDDFVRGIAREVATRRLTGTLDTLYLGGGTPSKLGGEGVASLTGMIRSSFALNPGAEVTLEANPEDVSPANARAWCSAGINRLSIGAQSFHDDVLAWMHRTHDADSIATAVHTARDAGIENVSLDLIFALPETLGRDLARDIDRAVALEPTHVSAYGLTVEPATPLGRWRARGDVTETPEDRWAEEFEALHTSLDRGGFEHYEVSNFARAGRRAAHNSAYWSGRSYLGVGPSAHGFDGEVRRWNESVYVRWLERTSGGEDPVAGSEALTPANRAAESVYLGLRTVDGLELDSRDDSFVEPWVDAGWARINERHGSRILSLTSSGWMRLDALAAALTSFRSRY